MKCMIEGHIQNAKKIDLFVSVFCFLISILSYLVLFFNYFFVYYFCKLITLYRIDFTFSSNYGKQVNCLVFFLTLCFMV